MILIPASIFAFAIFGTIGNGLGALNKKNGPSFIGATNWLNSKPLNLEDLRGKVILVDFWTYTCINWRRTLPYIREWSAKYKDQGLVVVGVHTPEFQFEQRPENVERAIVEMNIAYPVAIDSDYEIWRSFRNEYWPALYLIDAHGKFRYQQFGEGGYQESELMIQKLLKEVSDKNVFDVPAIIQPEGFEKAADWENCKSSENYTGYNRSQGFLSDRNIIPDEKALYAVPSHLNLNQWGLSGEWIIGKEQLLLNAEDGRIVYRFHARDLNLIMGQTNGVPIKFRVLIDGKPPGLSHGLDVDDNGIGTVSEQRMYQLIRQQGKIVDKEFQIEFFASGVEVYDFTFG